MLPLGHYLQDCIQPQYLFKLIQGKLPALYDVRYSSRRWRRRVIRRHGSIIAVQNIQLTSVQVSDGVPLHGCMEQAKTELLTWAKALLYLLNTTEHREGPSSTHGTRMQEIFAAYGNLCE